MKRSGPPKRKTPLARSGRVKPLNRERAAEKHARNFGDEAERVRAMPCLCVQKGREVWAQKMGRHNPCCRGDVVAAHVTARGMGASKGGRFDLVPLCDAHHDEQGVAGVQTFAARYGLDLRAEADAVTLEHPRPLGIRGLADRWAAWRCFWMARQAHESGDGPQPGTPDGAPLDTYETDALLGWVRRRMAAYLAGAASQGVDVEPQDWQAVGEWISLDLDIDEQQARALCEAAGWPS